MCDYQRLPNAKPVDVAGFQLRMPPGAHHFEPDGVTRTLLVIESAVPVTTRTATR